MLLFLETTRLGSKEDELILEGRPLIGQKQPDVHQDKCFRSEQKNGVLCTQLQMD